MRWCLVRCLIVIIFPGCSHMPDAPTRAGRRRRRTDGGELLHTKNRCMIKLKHLLNPSKRESYRRVMRTIQAVLSCSVVGKFSACFIQSSPTCPCVTWNHTISCDRFQFWRAICLMLQYHILLIRNWKLLVPYLWVPYGIKYSRHECLQFLYILCLL